MYFVEDLLGPEHLNWYREVRKVCATPQAVGEVFSNPAEYYPLIAEHVIDFIRTRVTAIGGITQAKKIANLCEVFGVKTAFQEGGENDPVNQLAAYHVDISEHRLRHSGGESLPAAGARDDAGHRRDPERLHVRQRPPGPRNRHQRRDGRQVPDHRRRNGGAYGTDRQLDGTVVIP